VLGTSTSTTLTRVGQSAQPVPVLGYDLNGDGRLDGFDTNFDGRIDATIGGYRGTAASAAAHAASVGDRDYDEQLLQVRGGRQWANIQYLH
jgi:hypothetical protein